MSGCKFVCNSLFFIFVLSELRILYYNMPWYYCIFRERKSFYYTYNTICGLTLVEFQRKTVILLLGLGFDCYETSRGKRGKIIGCIVYTRIYFSLLDASARHRRNRNPDARAIFYPSPWTWSTFSVAFDWRNETARYRHVTIIIIYYLLYIYYTRVRCIRITV